MGSTGPIVAGAASAPSAATRRAARADVAGAGVVERVGANGTAGLASAPGNGRTATALRPTVTVLGRPVGTRPDVGLRTFGAA